MRAPALAPLAMALLLAACGEDSWFGSADDPPLPGERISILERGANESADPRLADVRPALPPATDGAWPQAYGGPSHAAGHRALAEAPTLVWTVSIGQGEDNEERRIVYPPVASETTVFTLDAGGAVAAWAADTGKSLWRVDPTPKDERDGFGGGLAYDDGKVYFATGYAQVVVLDAATGDERWRAQLPTPSRAPTLDAGRLFAITIDNRLLAFDAATGQSLWAFEFAAGDRDVLGGAAPAAADGAVVAAMTTGEIVAFRGENGRITWDDALTAVRRIGVAQAIPAVRAPPVIADGRVFAVGAAGFSAAIDFATGARLWDRGAGGVDPPIVAGDFLYMVSDNGQLLAMQRANGLIVWATDLKTVVGDVEPDRSDAYVRLFVGPIAAGGRLIVVRSDGKLLFLRPEDGALDRHIDLPGKTVLAPIVANRTLYVLTEGGALAAYR